MQVSKVAVKPWSWVWCDVCMMQPWKGWGPDRNKTKGAGNVAQRGGSPAYTKLWVQSPEKENVENKIVIRGFIERTTMPGKGK